MRKRLAQLPAKIRGRAVPDIVQAHPVKYALWSCVSGTVAILAIIVLSVLPIVFEWYKQRREQTVTPPARA